MIKNKKSKKNVNLINIYYFMNDLIRVLLNRTRSTSINPMAVWMFPIKSKSEELIGKVHGGEDLSLPRGL